MFLRRLDLRGVAAADLADELPRPATDEIFPTDAVRAIVDEVRRDGDTALRALTLRFDGVDVAEVEVGVAEARAALARIPGDLRQALELAWGRITAYHAHEPPPLADFELDGVRVRHLRRPVARAGIYAPGGRARYPSTVLMCAAPARVAGVEDIVLTVPPGADGAVADETLAAAAIAGIDRIFRVGGAQAIAALAYGTATVPAVDVVVGPGNRFVAEAKRQVSGLVGIPAGFAGPSEVVVIADGTSPAAWAAVDVVVQAEHGPDGLAWLVTWSPEFADAVTAVVADLVTQSPRRAELEATLGRGGYAVVVDGPAEAAAVANAVAPEHLEIQTEGAEALLPLITRAAAVFVGPYAPASVGDYLAGPNHVLPTARTARFASALRSDDFRTHIHVVDLDAATLARLTPAVVTLAEAGWAWRPTPPRSRCVATRAAAMAEDRVRERRVPVRPDLGGLDAYHSPQVDVEVRLNTNESPLPPPEEWLAELRAELGRIDFNRYPDRDALALRAALGEHHGVDPARVFCANGSNEVLQSLLLAYGGPGRRVAVFEPTYTLHRHIAAQTGTEVVSTWRTPDHRLDLPAGDARIEAGDPVITFLCSPNNPTGRAETTAGRPPRARPYLQACWWWTRPTGNSSPTRRSTSAGPTAPEPTTTGAMTTGATTGRPGDWSWCGPSPRPGRWPPVVWATWWPIRPSCVPASWSHSRTTWTPSPRRPGAWPCAMSRPCASAWPC